MNLLPLWMRDQLIEFPATADEFMSVDATENTVLFWQVNFH
jgi:hypothetical protein